MMIEASQSSLRCQGCGGHGLLGGLRGARVCPSPLGAGRAGIPTVRLLAPVGHPVARRGRSVGMRPC